MQTAQLSTDGIGLFAQKIMPCFVALCRRNKGVTVSVTDQAKF